MSEAVELYGTVRAFRRIAGRGQPSGWGFRPAKDVVSLMSKEMTQRFGYGKGPRGARSKVLNDILRKALAHHRGKRELAK